MPLNTVPELARAASERLDLMEDRVGVLEMVPSGGGEKPLRIYTVDDGHTIDWVLAKRDDADEYAIVARPSSDDPDADWVPDGYQVANTLFTELDGDNAFNFSSSSNPYRAVYDISSSLLTNVLRFMVPPDLEIHVSKGFVYLFHSLSQIMDIDDMARVKVVNENNEVSFENFEDGCGVFAGKWIEGCDYRVTSMKSAYLNVNLFYLRNMDFSGCVDFSSAFYGISDNNFRHSGSTNIFNGSEPMNMSGIFANNYSKVFNHDINDPFINYDDGSISVEKAANLFNGKTVSTRTLKKFDFSNLITASSMFKDATVSGSDDISVLNNPNGKLTDSLSSFCEGTKNPLALPRIFHSGIDTSSVTSFSYLFSKMSYRTDFKFDDWLKNIKTDSATSFANMFQNNEIIDSTSSLSEWNVSKVTGASAMFSGCINLKTLSGLDKWDVSGFRNIGGMFSNCINLETTALSALDSWGSKLPENCVGIKNMFSGIPDNVTRPSWYAERASADPANPEGPNYDPVFDASRPEYDPSATWDGPDVFTIR